MARRLEPSAADGIDETMLAARLRHDPQRRHDLSCRDPLLACMALIGTAEQAHVAGLHTPPLTPMMMHYVNVEATVRDMALLSSSGVPNWWRCVKCDLSLGEDVLTPRINRCWRRVTVSSAGGAMAPFLELLSRRAPNVTTLAVSQQSAAAAAAVKMPYFARLTSLEVRFFPIDLTVLAASAPSLTQLALLGTNLTGADLPALGQLPKLRVLRLVEIHLESSDLLALDNCVAVEELELGPGPFPTLPCHRLCERLRSLAAHDPNLNATALRLPSLDQLFLEDPTDAELRAAAERRYEACVVRATRMIEPIELLRGVTQFDLLLAYDDTVGPAVDLTPLSALPFLRELEVRFNYDMYFNGAVVGDLRGAASLTRFSVSFVTATAFSDGLFAVPALTDLTIRDSRELTTVSHLEWCPALTSLTLERCGVMEDGLAELRHARRLRRLKLLRSRFCSTPPDFSTLTGCDALESVTYSTSFDWVERDAALPAQSIHRTWYLGDTSLAA